jgi:hypothetical protein
MANFSTFHPATMSTEEPRWRPTTSLGYDWDSNLGSEDDFAFHPMPEISDFQRTNSEFAKSEQKYPIKITLA